MFLIAASVDSDCVRRVRRGRKLTCIRGKRLRGWLTDAGERRWPTSPRRHVRAIARAIYLVTRLSVYQPACCVLIGAEKCPDSR